MAADLRRAFSTTVVGQGMVEVSLKTGYADTKTYVMTFLTKRTTHLYTSDATKNDAKHRELDSNQRPPDP